MHQLLNLRDKEARISERIYNDERVEKKVAKLVLWLLGAYKFDQAWEFEGQTFERQFKNVPYLSGWTTSVTSKELCTLTGLSDRFLRKYLKNPPKWLKAVYHDKEADSHVQMVWLQLRKCPCKSGVAHSGHSWCRGVAQSA